MTKPARGALRHWGFVIRASAHAALVRSARVAHPDCAVILTTSTLTYRTIDPSADAARVVGHQRDACVATFGNLKRHQGDERYLAWLAAKVEEFPEGFVLAFHGGRCVGHLELEVPYGLTTGYISLYYVTPPFRGMGLGRRMHQDYAERYFRSWEATRVELHVSPLNRRAVGFYQRLGYRFVGGEVPTAPLRRMAKVL